MPQNELNYNSSNVTAKKIGSVKGIGTLDCEKSLLLFRDSGGKLKIYKCTRELRRWQAPHLRIIFPRGR